MRRLVLLAATVLLLLPSAAPAKGLSGVLQVCGASGCRTIDRHVGHHSWELLAELTGGSAAGPALPGPFYILRILPLDERGRPRPAFPTARFFYAPRSERIRTSGSVPTDDGIWRSLETPPPALAAAAQRLRPFPAPILVRVEVGGRAARDPQSYLRLFRIRPAGREIADPAGRYPAGTPGIATIAAYWARVRRHWLPVNPTSRRRSPWGDDSTSVWVARRLPLVKRDGEIVRVPGALAERIRRARSLR